MGRKTVEATGVSGSSGSSGSSGTAVRASRGRKKAPKLTISSKGKRKKSTTRNVANVVEANIFADNGEQGSESKPRSWEEWEQMPPGESFTMHGQVFRKDDSAVVHSSDGDENPWLVHIVKIRVRPETETPWVLVHWYYSAEDLVAEYGPDSRLYLNDLQLSAKERVLSDRRDILSSRVFERVVNVAEWNEGEVYPPLITHEDYFLRTRFSWTKSQWEIAPGAHTCMLSCNRSYDPFLSPEIFNASHLALKSYYRDVGEDDGHAQSPSGMLLDADYMHFCSRPSCRRWFHRACLLHGGRYVEDAGRFVAGTREIRRLALDPWVEVQDVDSRLQRYTFPPSSSGKMSSAEYTALGLHEVLERDFHVVVGDGWLPESVVRVAVRPIVRRANGRRGRNLAGYMEEILLAQNLVHQQLELNPETFEKHMNEVYKYYGTGWMDVQAAYEYVREIMVKSRLLASPLPRYWDSLDAEMDAVYGEEVFPELLCANCFGAI